MALANCTLEICQTLYMYLTRGSKVCSLCKTVVEKLNLSLPETQKEGNRNLIY